MDETEVPAGVTDLDAPEMPVALGISKRRPSMTTVPSLFLCKRWSERVKARRSASLSGHGRVTSGPARKRVMGASPISEWSLRL
jgi:hypothetical protein